MVYKSTLNQSLKPWRCGRETGSLVVLCANRGISITNQLLLTENVSSYSPYMEAISARDRETKVVLKPTRMHPYSIEAGPLFNKVNWKVIAKAS